MNKNYNFERNKLLLPEYGRHVYKMVHYLMSIEDRELRNRQALAVIDVMGNINPMLRDTDGFRHKLWDHLFIISNFQLEVDSPFPIPTAQSLSAIPCRLNYPKNNIRMKHYGKNIAEIIRVVKNLAEGPEKQQVANNIACYMKSKSQEYNNEHANNDVIIQDIQRLSDNQLKVDGQTLTSMKNDFKPVYGGAIVVRHKKNNNKGGGKNHGNNALGKKYGNNNTAKKGLPR